MDIETIMKNIAIDEIPSHDVKKKTPKFHDKQQFSAYNYVLDNATCVTIKKLIDLHLFDFCCDTPISSGKEALIFFGSGEAFGDIAVKIFRVAALKFKHRSKYMAGDFRFRRGYSSSRNHLKLVTTWAKKEIINLVKIHKNGIMTPMPLYLKRNCLVMQFIGHTGIPHPKLKNATFSLSKPELLYDIYKQSLLILKKMYILCNLIHSDFSEYNLLIDESKNLLFVIDVSQSVEKDHPYAFDFLKRDIYNITLFFSRLNANLNLMRIETAFDFITHVYEFPVTKDHDFNSDYDSFYGKINNDYFKCELDVKSSQFISTPMVSSLSEINIDQIDAEYKTLLENDLIFKSRLLPNEKISLSDDVNDESDKDIIDCGDNNDNLEDSIKSNKDKPKTKTSIVNSRKHLSTKEEKQHHRHQVKEQKNLKKKKKDRYKNNTFKSMETKGAISCD